MAIVNDLLLEHQHTMFQIDSLLFSRDLIYLFEVKNYEGNFYIEGDKWHSNDQEEIKNPYHH